MEGEDRLAIATDGAARFCVSFVLAPDPYVARILSRATALVDAATAVLPFDLTLAPVALRFAPERATWSLDDDRAWVSVVASGDQGAPAPGLASALSNEAAARSGTATTDPGAQRGSTRRRDARSARPRRAPRGLRRQRGPAPGRRRDAHRAPRAGRPRCSMGAAACAPPSPRTESR